MKMRSGWVSNSSSSSYYVWGFSFPQSHFIKDKETMEHWFNKLDEDYNPDVGEYSMKSDLLNKIEDKGNAICDAEEECVFVGFFAGDDKNPPSSADKIIEEVRERFEIPENIDPHWFSRAWYDG